MFKDRKIRDELKRAELEPVSAKELHGISISLANRDGKIVFVSKDYGFEDEAIFEIRSFLASGN